MHKGAITAMKFHPVIAAGNAINHGGEALVKAIGEDTTKKISDGIDKVGHTVMKAHPIVIVGKGVDAVMGWFDD
jgi:hypothetical protein